jgi:sigma-B regulation protein RsbQ
MKRSAAEIFNVHISGKGVQPMLFAHGYGCDQQMWRFITPAFEDRYKIILFDYIGNGKADQYYYDPIKYNSLNGYADDVLLICEELDLTDIVFVGHSVSSIIGLLAAIKKPNIFSSIILVSPSPCYINDANYVGGFERREIETLLRMMENNFQAWAKSFAPGVMGNPQQPGLTEELSGSFCSLDPATAKQFARVLFLSDNRNDLKDVNTPSLILQCSEDILAPVAVGKYMQQHLAESKLQILNATGHCPHLSAPAETIKYMNNFLGKK